MPLEIVVGRAGSGKSKFCTEEIKKLAQSGKRAILIVPEQFSHEAESAVVSAVGYISDRIMATSFKRLSFSVLKACAKSENYADIRVKSMLMSKAVSEISPSLKIFVAAAKSPGFVSSLLDVVSEFKKAVLLPQDILNCAERIEDNDYFSQKLTELGKIYEKYNENFSENLADTQDIVTAASEYVEKSGIFCGAHVFVDEFFRFTRQERLFLKALSAMSVKVTLTACCDDLNGGSDVFDPCRESVKNIVNILKNTGDKLLSPITLDGCVRFASDELLHLEREFTSYPPHIYKEKTRDISVLCAADVYSEAVYTANKINRLVKEENFSYGEIAVIAGNFDRYSGIVKTVFDLYDIPVFIDDKKNILNHPIMLMLFSVFDILTGGFDTSDVLTYIKTELSPIDGMAADILENHALRAGIKNGDWLDDARFAMRTKTVFDSENELSKSEQSEIIELKNRALAPVIALKNRLMTSKKAADRIGAFNDFFAETELYEKTLEMTRRLSEQGDSRAAAEYASVYKLLTETFGELLKYLGDSQMGLERMKNILLAGFGEQSIGIVPTECDQIFFGDENRSVIKNVRALFVIGANTGAFPQEVSAKGILSDAERLLLEKNGFELAPDSKKRVFDSRFLVYKTLCIPKERLFISYALADFEGSGLRPSQLISALMRIFPNMTINYQQAQDLLLPEYVSTKKSAYNYVVCKNNEKDELFKCLKNELLKDANLKERLLSLNVRTERDMRAERLNERAVRNLYGEKMTGSVSRFEKYCECPFSFFIKYGLKAKENGRAGVGASDTGSLLHSIIEKFSKRVYEKGLSFFTVSNEQCEEIVHEITEELLKNSFIKSLYSKRKVGALLNRLEKLALRSATVIVEHVKRGRFEPCAFEFSFDERGDAKPIVLTLPNGAELSISGKIDRVDSFERDGKIYIKIVDYKSGKKQFSLSDIYNRLSLQLTVYLTAFCADNEKKQPAGMFYFRLSDPVTEMVRSKDGDEVLQELLKKYKMSGLVLSEPEIIEAMEKKESGYFATIPIMKKNDGSISETKSSCASGEEFKILSEYVNLTLAEIGEEIFTGKVDILPAKNGKSTACDFCEYKSACGNGRYFDAKYRNLLTEEREEIFEKMKIRVNGEK